jgi:hypothetical protein
MSSAITSNELTRLKRSRYWRTDDGRMAVQAWRESGLPLSTFAKRSGLSGTRVRWWRDRLREEPSVPLSAATLVPVTLLEGPKTSREVPTRMEVELPSGHVLRVGADFDTDALIRLVRALVTSC